jgi:hypothetical protein
VTVGQEHLYTAANWTLLLLVALIGVVILVTRWHKATAVPPMPVTPAALPRTAEAESAERQSPVATR